MKRGFVGSLCIIIAISLPVTSAKSEFQTWTNVMTEPTNEDSEQSPFFSARSNLLPHY